MREALLLPDDLASELRAKRQTESAAGPPIVFGGVVGQLGVRGLSRQPDTDRLLAEGLRGWSAIASRVVSDRVRGLRLIVSAIGAGGAAEPLPDHPLQQLLDRPGPIFGRRSLLGLTATHLQLTGWAFWQVLRDGLGVPRELWPMPPQFVEPVATATSPMAAVRVTSGSGGQTTLPIEDVVVFMDPDPESIYAGAGRLGPQATEFDAHRFMHEHLRSHFEHDATPATAIIAAPDARPPDDQQRQAFEARWRSAYNARRGHARGLPAFLPPGFSVYEFGGDRTADLVPLDERYASQILSAFGVSPISVGRDTNVNRATAETSAWLQDRNTVKPLADSIADEIERQLARRVDDRLRVAFEPFVQPDKDFELRREQQDLTLKVRSPQQVLRDRGVADPEAEAPWGEFPVGAFTDTPYTGQPDDGALLGQPESADDIDPGPGRAERSAEPERARDVLVRTVTYERGRGPDPEAVWRRNLARERQFVRKAERAIASIFDVQRREILSRLDSVLGSPPERAGAEGIVAAIFDPAGWSALFRARFETLRRRIATTALLDALRDIAKATGRPQPKAEGFELSQRAAALMAEQGADMVQKVNETTRRKLAATLSEGVLAGEAGTQLARRVNAVMRDRRRARTIARTELLKATQGAQVVGFAEGGVRVKQWNTQRDGDVRPSHRIDGQQVALNVRFVLADGHEAMQPGDSALPAHDVVQCRCFVTPVVGLESQE